MLMMFSVEEFLRQTLADSLQSGGQSYQSVTTGGGTVATGRLPVHDDEQALYLLQQCGHNMDEALRRRRMQSVSSTGKTTQRYRPIPATLKKYFDRIFVGDHSSGKPGTRGFVRSFDTCVTSLVTCVKSLVTC